MAGGGGQQQQGNPVVNLIEGLKGLLQNVQNVAMASQGIAPPRACRLGWSSSGNRHGPSGPLPGGG